jgi:hypothetical protein
VAKASGLAHARGAAQVMKSRGPRPPASPIETTLLLHLRAPVVVQATYLPYDYFSDAEWDGLVLGYYPYMANVDEDITFQDLAAAIRLFLRTKKVLFESNTSDVFENITIQDTEVIYRRALGILDRTRIRIFHARLQLSGPRQDTILPMALYQKLAWELTIAIILVRIVLALGGWSSDGLENSQWVNEICDIADPTSMAAYRPLGTFWLQLVLYIAYVGAEADEDRRRVWNLLQIYSEDIPGNVGALNEGVTKEAARYWRLEVGVMNTLS